MRSLTAKGPPRPARAPRRAASRALLPAAPPDHQTTVVGRRAGERMHTSREVTLRQYPFSSSHSSIHSSHSSIHSSHLFIPSPARRRSFQPPIDPSNRGQPSIHPFILPFPFIHSFISLIHSSQSRWQRATTQQRACREVMRPHRSKTSQWNDALVAVAVVKIATVVAVVMKYNNSTSNSGSAKPRSRRECSAADITNLSRHNLQVE